MKLGAFKSLLYFWVLSDWVKQTPSAIGNIKYIELLFWFCKNKVYISINFLYKFDFKMGPWNLEMTPLQFYSVSCTVRLTWQSMWCTSGYITCIALNSVNQIFIN